jgi:hypothetical protein
VSEVKHLSAVNRAVEDGIDVMILLPGGSVANTRVDGIRPSAADKRLNGLLQK